ncbi:MAG: FkbH like protein [Chthonomonadaceae bacterium]|nr:FkbH like protein [Chthonomonadaceae bacterium]
MNEITRQSIDLLLASGEHNSALAQMKTFFAGAPNLGNAQFILTRMKQVSSLSATPCRIAFLRSFTLEPVLPLMRAQALLYGLDVSAWVSDFNTYAQEMLAPDSALYRFNADVVVLALQTRDLVPDIWQRFTDLSAVEVETLLSQAIADLRAWILAFRSHSQADLILHNMELPCSPSMGLLDRRQQAGQTDAILRLNAEIQQLTQEHTGIFVLDYDGLMARYGRERWHDERRWLTMRMPIAADALNSLAQEYVRFLLPLKGRICKALVVDLDNTLWGGVLGEEGLHGIQIGQEYPGAAFLQLQRAILDLYRRGVILAVCSKNNLADAMEVFEKRAEMLLKTEHFAVLRVNWQDKAQNLREIAAELNIGIDALAFLDDNPVERRRVTTELPEVTVIDLPSDPMEYAAALRSCPVFERLYLSAEDQERGRYYAEQRQRAELEQGAGSLEDFYRSLEMEAEFASVAPATLARVAQLTQKTNQFNTTTRRYTEQQIADLAQDPDWQVISLRMSDRFGDNGLVGVAILHHRGEVSEIDTLLMSCRVIGRTVENALLAMLAQEARACGSQRLQGWFLPTKKNVPAREFFALNGFKPLQEQEDGVLWELDLRETIPTVPAWIRCRELAPA